MNIHTTSDSETRPVLTTQTHHGTNAFFSEAHGFSIGRQYNIGQLTIHLVGPGGYLQFTVRVVQNSIDISVCSVASPHPGIDYRLQISAFFLQLIAGLAIPVCCRPIYSYGSARY